VIVEIIIGVEILHLNTLGRNDTIPLAINTFRTEERREISRLMIEF